MTALRYAVRATALSLLLTALGTLGVVGVVGVAASPAQVAGTEPIGGPQLASRGVIVNLTPGVPAPPAMPGASFLIADMGTGQILAARAPHARSLPASTLKTLTALTLIPRLDANKQIMVQPEDVRVEGSHVGILPGTAYSVRSLMQGLLMSSGNDAAYALARANDGVGVTLQQMNTTAAGLGALDTLAKDPSGLDQPGQSSSAYDLALIGRAAMRLPDFRGYVATKHASFPGGRSKTGQMVPAFKINNHQTLLFNYAGAIGIKNGYTVAAQQTFIGAATRGEKTYIVTEMASPNGSWRPTAALLDWAFAHGTAVTPIGSLVEPGAATRPAPAAQAPAARGVTVSQVAEPARAPSPFPWAEVAGLIGAVALVGALAARRRRVLRNRR
jgi:D-alanyl-D-alanine carboxypeptidase (penicillin-binding protein 5/6)